MEGLATLHDLQTVYDSEAALDLVELAIVKRFNR